MANDIIRKAQPEVYGAIDLISAAIKLSENGPIEECLKAARSKLRELANDLDKADTGAPLPDEQKRVLHIARGHVPAAVSKDGESDAEPATLRERREAVHKAGDAAQAIYEAGAALHAINGMGRMLQQDTIRDEGDWVLSIAHMLVEESDRMIEFLDRRGGW
jgi:hypothetical protein